MAKIHRSYRIEEGTLDKLTEWAEAHNQSTTQAMEYLLWRGLEADERTDTATDKDAELQELQARLEATTEQRALMADNLRDLRELRATLTAQLTAKDAQIAQMQEALNHAQFLQAMEATSKLTGETAEAMKQGGIWAWLAKKIGR